MRTHKPQLSPSVPNRNIERIIVQREEVPVSNPEEKREREVDSECRGRVNTDVIESNSSDLERRVGRVEKENGGREKKDSESEEDTAAEEEEGGVGRWVVVGENDDVLGNRVRVGRYRSIGNGGGF